MAAPTRFVATALVALTSLAASCTSGSDDVEQTTATTTQPNAEVTQAPDSRPLASPPPVATGAPDTTGSPPTTASTPISISVVPETGVPGLDSDDSFCAAWSRFGGSWQVLVQAGSSGDAAQLARLEVIASTVVDDAYTDVFAVWPPELESERQVVADDYFGAFQRRSAEAAGALLDAGASDDDIATLGEAWAQALEGYDPTAAQIEVAVPSDLEPLVDVAATAFAEQRVPLQADPSMVITAATPLTDEFLATACPDQGWIVGQDVVGNDDGV